MNYTTGSSYLQFDLHSLEEEQRAKIEFMDNFKLDFIMFIKPSNGIIKEDIKTSL